jgi:DNA-directed RNA polymerase specialized sigma24 family protein
MEKSPRVVCVRLDPKWLDKFVLEQRLWFESPEEVRAGLRWGRRKCALLLWVRATMAERLTARERDCIGLYFFEGRSFAQVGLLTGTHASSVFRAVQRGIRKLRQAAGEEPSWQRLYALGGQRPRRRPWA